MKWDIPVPQSNAIPPHPSRQDFVLGSPQTGTSHLAGICRLHSCPGLRAPSEVLMSHTNMIQYGGFHGHGATSKWMAQKGKSWKSH